MYTMIIQSNQCLEGVHIWSVEIQKAVNMSIQRANTLLALWQMTSNVMLYYALSVFIYESLGKDDKARKREDELAI